jgi:hypothetical protein
MPTLFPVEILVPKLLEMAQTLLSVDWKTSNGEEYDETVEELIAQAEFVRLYLDQMRDGSSEEEEETT